MGNYLNNLQYIDIFCNMCKGYGLIVGPTYNYYKWSEELMAPYPCPMCQGKGIFRVERG